MEQFIGCDAHKKFPVFVAVNEKGQAGEALGVVHDRQVYREFLARLPPYSSSALEASGVPDPRFGNMLFEQFGWATANLQQRCGIPSRAEL